MPDMDTKDKGKWLKQRSQELRKEMTPQERKLWYLFLNRYHPRFMRQYVEAGYILDFYCRTAKLAIEIDGSQHFVGEAHDTERTQFLSQRGIRLIRFTNKEVDRDFHTICKAIDSAVRGEW